MTPVVSGSRLDQAPVLIVKPIEAGLETDLIIPTDRRTYVLRLLSDSTRFISRLALQYPGNDQAKWTTFQAQQDAARHDAEALAEQQRGKDKQAGVLQMADGSLDRLYFDYKLDGDPAYLPERVLDDGVHTYLIYPDDGRLREMPTLLMVVNGKTELVNAEWMALATSSIGFSVRRFSLSASANSRLKSRSPETNPSPEAPARGARHGSKCQRSQANSYGRS